ncbi:MAG: riboflavin synthase [Dehalococcoidia bacterium]|nr:riboflavin synthase [Dehalococcoidia bacterium]
MFTGIVEEVGVVRGTGTGWLTIGARNVLEDIKPGDSLAINGACLTVTSADGDVFSVDVMPETFRRTNIGRLHYGDLVNLERAMPADGRFGGHLVQGHVDGTGRVMALAPEAGAVIARISAPAELTPYVVNKGFVAVDGVSLTIVDCGDSSFSVSLVAYTREHTTVGGMRPGDIVNLEVDVIAKYVERLRRLDSQGVTLDFLEEHGFSKAR